MKYFYLILPVLVVTLCNSFSQIPFGYYDNADTATCASLKTKLSNIIKNGRQSKTYAALWNQYTLTDIKPRTVGTGSLNVIYDIYSTNPNGVDPYQFTPLTNQCGNYTKEGDCYNREHIIPLSWFSGSTNNPGTATDYNFIYPTDGLVNAKHANYPYGELNTSTNPSYTSATGNKLGISGVSGISGNVFEPLDEFKGDIARAYFYFATMYQDSIPAWSANPDASQVLDNNTFPSYKIPFIKLMLKWHNQDPVSIKEITRNNGAYNFQSNRNPFIDSPQYVNRIWNESCSGLGTLPLEIISFTARFQDRKVLLNWNLAGSDLKTIEILAFDLLGKPASVYQETNPSSLYGKFSFLLPNNSTIQYFRLKVTSTIGNQHLSNTVAIPSSLIQSKNILFYPNPSNGVINFSKNNMFDNEEGISFIVYDQIGKVVFTTNITNIQSPLTLKNLPSGMYYGLLNSKNFHKSFQIQIKK